MKCLSCKINDAGFHVIYGYISCESCRQRQSNLIRPKHDYEFTSEEIKEGRKTHAKEILQPFRSGHLSKEYIKAYGTKGLKVTKEEIKNAKNTWESYYND